MPPPSPSHFLIQVPVAASISDCSTHLLILYPRRCLHDLLSCLHLWEVEFEDISTKRRETASSPLPFHLSKPKSPSFFLSSIMEAHKLFK
ncbi:hypothetical protein L2E82_48478 [Cichorium intybus]|uniref:Uncharacterized protein n=1 Tax=Cichorium intybus TaxID=13427 RepID=A0ACB8YY60_CICIN|nr:hypothetical protein L2E82_48478 [Cichorium intybus]